jgi:hypothetical protein
MTLEPLKCSGYQVPQLNAERSSKLRSARSAVCPRSVSFTASAQIVEMVPLPLRPDRQIGMTRRRNYRKGATNPPISRLNTRRDIARRAGFVRVARISGRSRRPDAQSTRWRRHGQVRAFGICGVQSTRRHNLLDDKLLLKRSATQCFRMALEILRSVSLKRTGRLEVRPQAHPGEKAFG